MNINGIEIGYVASNTDPMEGGRIKARIIGKDNKKYPTDNTLPFCTPLIPKIIHIIPKVGEAVILFVDDKNERYYIGPIISQNQSIDKDDYKMGATSTMQNAPVDPKAPASQNSNTHGAYPETDEIAICGRKDSDIIMSDYDVRIRCGAKNVTSEGETPTFNKKNPAFLKLKYHNDHINDDEFKSTATIAADEITLVSHRSTDPVFTPSKTTRGEMISESDMKALVEQCHVLPYGDELVKFLKMFVTAFQTHTHPYSGLPPCKDDTYMAVDNYIYDDMLSKHIRIN